MSKDKVDSKASNAKERDTKKSDVVEINFGKYFTKARDNPWVVATFALAAILVVVLAVGSGGGITGNVVSEQTVGQNVLSFLNSQVDEEVTLNSVANKGSYYEIIVNYQGQSIPLQATLDGNYMFTELIPLSSGIAPAPTGSAPSAGGKVEVSAELIEDSPMLGSASAQVTIVEFTDYECPFCQKHFLQTYPLIKSNYVDTGKVKYVLMDFPLSFHPSAQKAAEAAHCARDQGGDEAYFEMHDLLFENQQSLNSASYLAWAGQLGLNTEQFSDCLNTGKHAAKVQASLQYGTSLGVSGTPGFFINGVPVSGAQPYNVFQQIIEQELAN